MQEKAKKHLLLLYIEKRKITLRENPQSLLYSDGSGNRNLGIQVLEIPRCNRLNESMSIVFSSFFDPLHFEKLSNIAKICIKKKEEKTGSKLCSSHFSNQVLSKYPTHHQYHRYYGKKSNQAQVGIQQAFCSIEICTVKG